MIIQKKETVQFEEVKELSDTVRGAGGIRQHREVISDIIEKVFVALFY